MATRICEILPPAGAGRRLERLAVEQQQRAEVEVVPDAAWLIFDYRMRDPLPALDVMVIRIDQTRAGQFGHREQPFETELPELNGGVVDDQQRVGSRRRSRNRLHGAAPVERSHRQTIAAFERLGRGSGGEQADSFDEW